MVMNRLINRLLIGYFSSLYIKHFGLYCVILGYIVSKPKQHNININEFISFNILKLMYVKFLELL